MNHCHTVIEIERKFVWRNGNRQRFWFFGRNGSRPLKRSTRANSVACRSDVRAAGGGSPSRTYNNNSLGEIRWRHRFRRRLLQRTSRKRRCRVAFRQNAVRADRKEKRKRSPLAFMISLYYNKHVCDSHAKVRNAFGTFYAPGTIISISLAPDKL